MSQVDALRLAEIAAMPGKLADRASALLVELRRHVPFDGSWLAVADPRGRRYASLASTSLDEGALQCLSGPGMAQTIEAAGTHRAGPPVSVSDLPYPADELWAECLTRAGFNEALTAGLFAHGSRHVGFVALLFGSAQPPADAVRRRLAELLPILSRGIDPMRSLLLAAQLVHGATAGVALCADGGAALLPGLAGEELLLPGSPIVNAARTAIAGGQLYASFLWPRGDRHAPDGHARVTVLSNTDDPSMVNGVVLLSPARDLRGLTPRELEVLGLVVDGCPNQEIASVLVVAPRTVAAHMEHILIKLQASSRTVAAVRAEREGLYVPRR